MAGRGQHGIDQAKRCGGIAGLQIMAGQVIERIGIIRKPRQNTGPGGAHVAARMRKGQKLSGNQLRLGLIRRLGHQPQDIGHIAPRRIGRGGAIADGPGKRMGFIPGERAGHGPVKMAAQVIHQSRVRRAPTRLVRGPAPPGPAAPGRGALSSGVRGGE